MAQCTAPIKGHTPGSLSEKECPVHGQKHRKPTPIRKFATININNNTAKNSISNIPYNELNLPQKAQREAHIEILVDDIGVTKWNNMSKMDRAYEVKQYEQSIENGNTPEISKEDHDDFRNTIKKRYVHPIVPASFLSSGMKIIAHSNDEYKTMQNGYRDIDLEVTKNEEINGSTIMTTATNIDDETDIYYFATTRLTDGTQTTRNITIGDDKDPLTQVQFRQLGVRA